MVRRRWVTLSHSENIKPGGYHFKSEDCKKEEKYFTATRSRSSKKYLIQSPERSSALLRTSKFVS